MNRPPALERRVETGLVVLLLLGLLGYWTRDPRPFFMPNNDYFSFDHLARDLAAWRLPDNFKRMPVFPALMALLHGLWPRAEQPYLNAALALNLGFSAAFLWLVYRIAARVIGPGAVLVAAGLACAVQFQSSARQPLVDPSLGCFVALALWLRLKDSRWCWAAVGLALLSRLDTAVLIPLFLWDGLTAGIGPESRALRPTTGAEVGSGAGRQAPRQRVSVVLRRELPWAVLAVIPAAAWFLLGHRYGEAGSGYLDLMEGMGFTPAWRFPAVAFEQTFGGWLERSWLWLLAPGVLLLLYGLLRSWRAERRGTLLLLGHDVLTVAAIVAFGISKGRYAYAIQWTPLVFLARGSVDLGRGLWRRLVSRAGGTVARSLALIVVTAIVLLPATVAARGGLRLASAELHKVRYHNIESYLLGAWARDHLGPGDGLVTLATSQVEFVAVQLPADRVVSFANLVPEGDDPALLAAAMRARGLRHVAYTFREQPRDSDGAYYHRLYNVPLAERFAQGAAVPGFRHLARLPVPAELEHADVQIYELDRP